jgi:hypothetical protein
MELKVVGDVSWLFRSRRLIRRNNKLIGTGVATPTIQPWTFKGSPTRSAFLYSSLIIPLWQLQSSSMRLAARPNGHVAPTERRVRSYLYYSLDGR